MAGLLAGREWEATYLDSQKRSSPVYDDRHKFHRKRWIEGKKQERSFCMGSEAIRTVKVSLIQQGPATTSKENRVRELLEKVEEVAEKEHPDFIMPTELSTTQYFATGVFNPKYLDWAEHIPGPSTEQFAEKAEKYHTCIILPLIEKGSIEGLYYNSAVVIGPDGKIVEGVLPDGTRIPRYAKVHLPYMPADPDQVTERFYFKEGPGFPVFDTQKAKIGILICFDRRFPESFRMLALQGAEIAFVPTCSPTVPPKPGEHIFGAQGGGSAKEMYTPELRTRALENCMWVCSANRVGLEQVGNQKTQFYGLSAIIHPSGRVVAQASSEHPEVIHCEIDLEENSKVRHSILTFKLRRPETYPLLNKLTV
jgi:predicted amidohydrolase